MPTNPAGRDDETMRPFPPVPDRPGKNARDEEGCGCANVDSANVERSEAKPGQRRDEERPAGIAEAAIEGASTAGKDDIERMEHGASDERR